MKPGSRFWIAAPLAWLGAMMLLAAAALAPASAPEEQRGVERRFAEKLALSKASKYDLVLIGDSVTQNLEHPGYREKVWEAFYAPRQALNLGFSGASTRNILWDLQHGLLDGQTPKVALLLVGNDNSVEDERDPQPDAAEAIAAGIEANVNWLRAHLPGTKILLLRILPLGERPNPRRAFNDRASELAAARVVDWKTVYYGDVNHVFLNLDRTARKALLPDFQHPSPEGAFAMAREIEPLLAQLMGDRSKAPADPNSAVVPAPKLENDFYDWWGRHEAELDAHRTINPQVVMIGDSITHMWGGPPASSKVNGAAAWKELFGGIPVLNLGFGWDRTQNVLWRLDHGEFDGLHPRWVVLTIGVNNFATGHARPNTSEEVCQGILAILGRIRSKSPESRMIVMGVLPAGARANDPRREKIRALNTLVAKAVTGVPDVKFIDITEKLLTPDGRLAPGMMTRDDLHPAEKGYAVWARALIEAGIREK